MPTFEIAGKGKTSGRKRKRTVRAIDSATALALMEADSVFRRYDIVSDLDLKDAARRLDDVASLKRANG